MQTKVQPDPRDQHVPTALYRLYGTGGTLLYIGVTDNPERRFNQHDCSKPWWPQVAEKTIEWHPSRDRALAEEATAIKAETPVYNIDHNPAAPSYHWPPAGMPTDRVDAIEREASTLPASEAEGMRRAAFEEFTRAELDERATAPSTPTGQRLDRDRSIAALPKVVDDAMRNTVAEYYTPELAAQVADFVAAELRQPANGTLTPKQTPCQDGVAWCDGDPVNHTDDDDHRHQGAEHTLNGSYLCDPSSDGIATFYIAKWHDSQPHLVFQGTGLWADIDLAQVDELIGDAVPWLTQLIATRRHLAILLDPGSTPFTQTDDQQTASAAFCVATDSMRIALDKSPDPAGLLQAMRTYLDMAETEGTA